MNEDPLQHKSQNNNLLLNRGTDYGVISIDFLIGFSIFIITFIIVITMTSGILINLQERSIDYDAIAYRTGVILVEDAGAVDKMIWYLGSKDWQNLDLNDNPSSQRSKFYRLGLRGRLSKFSLTDYLYSRNGSDLTSTYFSFQRNILQKYKIQRFFNNNTILDFTETNLGSLIYPQDIYNKTLFSVIDYYYCINLTLLDDYGNPVTIYTLPGSDQPPSQNVKGYIKRLCFISEPGNITIKCNNDVSSVVSNMTININFTEPVPYEFSMDPYNNDVRIFFSNITNPAISLTSITSDSLAVRAQLSVISDISNPSSVVTTPLLPPDGPSIPITDKSCILVNSRTNNISKIITDIPVNITMQFNDKIAKETTYGSDTTYFVYNYSIDNDYSQIRDSYQINPPRLIPGILEIWIW